MQRQYDDYIRHEVMPFVRAPLPVAGRRRSGRWARRSARITPPTRCFKHPDVVKRCFALSGVYDMKRFMGGAYDDNFYFNNPVDYLANLSDAVDARPPRELRHPHRHRHRARGSTAGEAYRLSEILASRGIRHHLDDWGPLGGHDWPYWKHQMREYLNQ